MAIFSPNFFGPGFSGEEDAEGSAGLFKQTRHAERERVRDDRAFAPARSDEIAEVSGFVIEAAAGVGLVQLDDAAIEVVNGRVSWVPPVGAEEDVAAWSA